MGNGTEQKVRYRDNVRQPAPLSPNAFNSSADELHTMRSLAVALFFAAMILAPLGFVSFATRKIRHESRPF